MLQARLVMRRLHRTLATLVTRNKFAARKKETSCPLRPWTCGQNLSVERVNSRRIRPTKIKQQYANSCSALALALPLALAVALALAQARTLP